MIKKYWKRIALILLIVPFFYCYPAISYGAPFTMPNVVGLELEAAKQQIINACGIGRLCRTNMSTPQKNAKAANNHVYDVQPAPGQSVGDDDIIRLYYSVNTLSLSEFNNLKTIPDVVGKTTEEAVAVLNSAGWESFTPAGFATHKIAFEYVSKDPNNRYTQNGTVLGSAYSSDGWAVVLTVLKKDSTPMPAVVGKSYAEAEAILKATGLFKEIKREEVIYSADFLNQYPSRKSELNTIVKQSPTAGTNIDPDAVNYAWISEGVSEADRTVEVPNIAQMSEADAVAQLKYWGLVPKVSYLPTSSSFLGGKTSVKSEPGQGSKVKAGTLVSFTVYQYKPQVPSLTGFTLEEAKDKILALGLKYEIVQESTIYQFRDGQIASTSPAARTQVEPGSVVKIVVYKNDKAKIPNLVNMTEEKAIAYLQENKRVLKYTVVYEETARTAQLGTVSKTEPGYNATVDEGDTVTLYVRKQLQSVPDVVGKSLTQATSILENYGFIVSKGFRDSKDPDKVLAQSQEPGKPSNDWIITLIVGKLPDNVRLPSVVYKSQQEAIDIITGAGFTYKIQPQKVYTKGGEGRVVHMYPGGNNMVPPDTQVTIYVGSYVGTIPNVVGLSEAEAQSRLSQAGFAGLVIYTKQGTPGTVLNQKPDAGSEPSSGAGANFVNLFVTEPVSSTAKPLYDPMLEDYVIPHLKDFSLMEARTILADKKIDFIIEEIMTGPDRAGKVLGTYPPPYVKVQPGRPIVVKVGIDQSRVPDVIGMTAQQAAAVIRQTRLNPVFLPPKNLGSTGGNAGAVVVEQNPAPGSRKQNPTVYLTMANEVLLPDLMGKHMSEAIYQLRLKALKYDIEYVTVAEGAKSGMVLQMIPGPNRPVSVANTRVQLKIGKIVDTVPDVIGKTESEAESILKNLNFVVTKEYLGWDRTNNVVAAQSQVPGAKRGSSGIRLMFGTQEDISAMAVPTPVVRAAVLASVQAPAKELAQGAPAAAPVFSMTAEEEDRIRALYSGLSQAYEYKDESQLTNLLSSNWASADGATVMDVEDNLRSKFTVFDSIECQISNLNISKSAANLYRTNYDIEITGTIFDADITRREKSSVTEEIIMEGGSPKINRTLSGTFVYVE